MKRWIGILVLLVCYPCLGGRSFNGTSDNISAPGIGTPLDISSGSITISAWFYPTAVDNNEHDVVSHWQGANGSQFIIAIGGGVGGGNSNQLQFNIGNGGPLTGVYGVCETVTPGQWYHVILWVDATGKYSGSPAAGCGAPGPGQGYRESRIPGGASFDIGGRNGLPTFEGTIAEVAYWNTILSPEERGALDHTCPLSVRRDSIVGYFPLWGSSGSSIEPDLSGKGDNAALSGTGPANHAPCAP